MIIIELNLDATITRLAGNQLGERIFNEQVKEEIKYDDRNVIKFPDFIDNVAISFVQGFVKEILENITLEEFNNKIEVKGKERVVENFMKSLNY